MPRVENKSIVKYIATGSKTPSRSPITKYMQRVENKSIVKC
jgi:hypothetical protein